MLGSCTRKLVFRWTVFITLIGEAWIGVWALLSDRLPVATVLQFGDINSKTSHVDLRWIIPRWVDPLVMLIPLAILIWMIVDLDRIQECWHPGKTEAATMSLLAVGIAMGSLGSAVIIVGGFPFLVGGTIITSACVIGAALYHHHGVKRAFLFEIVAVLVIWTLTTAGRGTLSGAFYAGSALLIAFATHFVIAFWYWFIYCILEPGSTAFGRKFLAPVGATFTRIMLDPCKDET